MNTLDILTQARSIVATRWQRAALGTRGHPVCALGALCEVAGVYSPATETMQYPYIYVDEHRTMESIAANDEDLAALVEAERILAEQVNPERLAEVDENYPTDHEAIDGIIWGFNDSQPVDDNTKILAVFDKVIDELVKQQKETYA